MNEFLSSLNRERIVRWTAIYLVIYVIINLCAGLVFGVVGGLSAAAGALTAASVGGTSADAAAASTSLIGIGGLSVIMGILYLISVPICGVAAFGLFQRKTWARNAAVVALGYTTLISLVGSANELQQHHLGGDQPVWGLPVLERCRDQSRP